MDCMESSAGFRHGRDMALHRGLHQPKKHFFACQGGGNRTGPEASTTALHQGLRLGKSGAKGLRAGNDRRMAIITSVIFFSTMVCMWGNFSKTL